MGRYYSAPFKVQRGGNHGYILSPTISNMVVDAVILRWVILVSVEEVVPEVFINVVQWMSALF